MSFTKNSSNNPRNDFAVALQALFAESSITPDQHQALGAEVAMLQKPPRHTPYHHAVVAGWAKGELLPTAAAFQALQRIPSFQGLSAMAKLAPLHRAAQKWESTQQRHPTELGYAMGYVCSQLGIQKTALANDLSNYQASLRAMPHTTKTGREPLPNTQVQLSHLIPGQRSRKTPKQFTYYLQRRVDKAIRDGVADDLPNLVAIHEQTLREHADHVWYCALQNHDLGGLINACRVRLGVNGHDFYMRVAAVADIPCNDINKGGYVNFWETNEHFPIIRHMATMKKPITLCEPLVDLMKIVDYSPERLAKSIGQPWFDEQKEMQFRTLFREKVRGHSHKYTVPSDAVSPVPDMRKVAPTLKVREAQLKDAIITSRYRTH